MSSARLEGLSFAFCDASPIIEHADASLVEGWTGLVGENGAGKTTLLQLIAGEIVPDAGRVLIEPDGARVVLCPQRIDFAGPDIASLAVRDDGEARRISGALRLDPAVLARWETLSPGERKRWQVGAALARCPDILLLDEPTNHVDAEARALLLDALRRFRGVGALVSHDRALLEALAERTLRLHRGQARLYPGSYSKARSLWEAEASAVWSRITAAQDEALRAARRLAEARRRRDAAERSIRASSRNAKRTKHPKWQREWAENRLGRDVTRFRAESERAFEAIPGAPTNVELGRSVFLRFEPSPRPVLLSLEADEIRAGSKVLLRDVCLALGRGDRVRLAGPNGSGKTTLLEALLAHSTIPPGRLLFLPQEPLAGLGPTLLSELRALDPEIRGRVLSLVASLGSDPERLLVSADPSPGEARKLHLALGLGRHAWALVLDEPTNHLDLPTVERLEEALAAYPGAILLVTHDDALAGRCTTRTWRIDGERIGV